MAKRYQEYKQINYAQVARDILAYWKENEVFEESITRREGAPRFTFYEGPPSANGTPGIHHVMARTVKDLFCRFKTMEGFQVERKGGWDTHGLPVEIQVEKELGITKDDIGKKISVAEYNDRCKQAVMKYKDIWDDLTEKMGYWVDLDHPYITFNRDYMESIWWLLKQLYDKDLLYKGYTIQPYSPAAGTGLSSHELNQPGTYKPLKDISITAQFKVSGTEDEYFLAWTTTPWTLPANSALAVGKGITYVKVKTFNSYTYKPITVILAKDRMSAYFNPKAKDLTLADYKPKDKLIPYEVVGEMKGSDLEGMDYEQLMPYVPLPKPAFTVLIGDFVTTEDGTGIVHVSKTFGADDFRVTTQYGVPGVFVKDDQGNDVPIVNKQGRFVEEITDFAGMPVKNYDDEDESDPNYRSTDTLIAIKLKEENKAFRVEKYEHSYPHCWRTDKPILYYPLDSWFIKTTALKDRLVALNNTINWKPKATGEGRFGNWLENLVDWNLSRSRYWGTPLPIWVTEDRTEEKCIGSLQELKDEVGKAVEAGLMEEMIPEDFDLHRPYVDDVVLVSSKGEPMRREPDLIDVWFDSGAMPYAQWHHPFENKEQFDKSYPADFIAEGVDQTRGWFFTLHAIAGMVYDSVAFKNVVSNGLVLDKNGNKMSKRLGNAVDPFVTIDNYGPDATRWYMMANANPWDNLKFDTDGVVEVQRRFFGTLTNTYAFFALYANIDDFHYDGNEIPVGQKIESDRWILSRLNSLIKKVKAAYQDYEPTLAARAIQDFVTDDLSNWYVRLNRRRFWKGEFNSDKQAAYETLYQCLVKVAQMAAPMAPFYADWLYKNLVDDGEQVQSVHFSHFPEADEARIDLDLEEKMNLAQRVSSLVHSLRRKDKIKVRQPLSRILVPVLNEHIKHQIEAVEELIKSEVNVKAVEYITDTTGIVTKKIKPDFRKLGKVYGPKIKFIAGALAKMDTEAITAFETAGSHSLEIDGGPITLAIDEVEITTEDIPGWSVASENGVTVALDVSISEELKQEGIARDLVNRVQNMRKDMGLEVQDKIDIDIEKNQELVNMALEANREYICRETQALSLELIDKLEDGKVLDLDEFQLKVKIKV